MNTPLLLPSPSLRALLAAALVAIPVACVSCGGGDFVATPADSGGAHVDAGRDVSLSPIIIYFDGSTGVGDGGADAILDDGGELPGDSSGDATQDSSSSGCSSPALTLCADSCVNVSTDPNNCGRCGHSCAGAGCTMGLCDAVTVVNLPTGLIGDLTSDSTSVFWTDTANNSVNQVNVSDTGTIIALATGLTNVGSVGVSGTTVGFTSMVSNPVPALSLEIATAGIANSATVPQAVLAGGSTVTAQLATTGGFFYPIVNFIGRTTMMPEVTIERWSTSAAYSPLWMYGYGTAGRIVGNASGLFFTFTGSTSFMGPSSSIVGFWNFSSSTMGTLWTGAASSLGTDGVYLYWVTGGAIYRTLAHPAAQVPVIIAPSIPSTPDRLASDAKNVYFGATGVGGTGIYSVPAAGGGAQALIASALGIVVPTAVFAAGGYVYWAENTTSPVIRRVIAP